MDNSNRLTSRFGLYDFVLKKMTVPVNDKIVVAEMRQKFRSDFLSAAALTRHPPLSGDAAPLRCCSNAAPTAKRGCSNENLLSSLRREERLQQDLRKSPE